jgi:uncharacterized protein (TIGR02147 family)
MKQESIFDFNDYKAYLDWKIRSMPAGGRGFRSKLAEHIRSQKAFVSQVLKGEAHFNLEHADSINKLLHHDREESRYFLLLIQEIRAGTESLRDFFHSQRIEILNARLMIKNRLKTSEEISEANKGKYYSSWIYGAIRVGLTIPSLRKRENLLQALAIKENHLLEALTFLEGAGLVERRGEEYFPTKVHLHLGHDDSLIVRHHTNWRMKAMDAISKSNTEELHYSSVVSISKKDREKIRSILVGAVEKSMQVVKDSAEEELCVICADLFPIT